MGCIDSMMDWGSLIFRDEEEEWVSGFSFSF